MSELRPWQKEDYEFYKPRKRVMILNEPRLGKTPQGVKLLEAWDSKTTLIVCPNNALYVWRDHIVEWLGPVYGAIDVRVFAKPKSGSGYETDRMLLWKRARSTEHTYYICNYAVFLRDQTYIGALPIDCVVMDEAKRIRNHKSKAYKALYEMSKKPWLRVIFTEGTPTKRGPKDFYTMLSICDSDYSSYWDFVEFFHDAAIDNWGQSDINEPNQEHLPLFHTLLHQHARVRFRKDVAPQMPKVERQQIHLDMDDEQRKLYRTIGEVKYAFTESGQLVVAATDLEKSLRLRQILCCPKIVDKELEEGAAIDALAESLEEAENPDDKHVVIYTAFRQALPYFQSFLQKRGLGPVGLLYGGIHPEDQQAAIRRFNETRGIIICTIRYAEAFSLAGAAASYFIGAEWDPNTNRQAEDRLVPQQGVHPIYAGYYLYNGTVDGEIVERLNSYQRIIDATLKATP